MPARAKTPVADGSAAITTIRIELLDTDPPIWREVEVSVAFTLLDLHEVVQAVMGWFDYHLWEFGIAKQRYGRPIEEGWNDVPLIDADTVRLAEVLRPRRTRIDYLYDFGDNWEFLLTAGKARPAEPGAVYPRYLGGERNAPPEDCGGTWGFYDKLDILADPKHPDHAETAEWFGDYDPVAIDAAAIREALAELAPSAKPAKIKKAKKIKPAGVGKAG